MSGGFFDYSQYRINDAIHDIEAELKRNNKTVQEYWDSCDDEKRELLYDYEKPWSALKHPCWVEDEAERTADKALGNKKFGEYTANEKKQWNKIRGETIAKIINDHNSGFIRPNYSDKTVNRIKSMIITLKKARIYMDRIDWLFSGDDGEDEFHRRIDEDLKEEGLTDE